MDPPTLPPQKSMKSRNEYEKHIIRKPYDTHNHNHKKRCLALGRETETNRAERERKVTSEIRDMDGIFGDSVRDPMEYDRLLVLSCLVSYFVSCLVPVVSMQQLKQAGG